MVKLVRVDFIKEKKGEVKVIAIKSTDLAKIANTRQVQTWERNINKQIKMPDGKHKIFKEANKVYWFEQE